VVYAPGPKLLKQRPVSFSIFGRRKLNAMLGAQFGFAKSQEGAKGWIYEDWLTIQSLNHNPNGTRVENITERSTVLRATYYLVTHGTSCIPLALPPPQILSPALVPI